MTTKMDYTEIRNVSISMNKLYNPDINFDIKWKFYYDETNNFKKLHLVDRDTFNVSVENNFILGGLCHDSDDEINEKDIFKDIQFQKNIEEVKFKHLAKGLFTDILKSKKIEQFLNNILASPLYIHYQSFNPLYYSLVDIVDSMIMNSGSKKDHFLEYNRVLKATLYELLKENIEHLELLICNYNYPDIKKTDISPFVNELILITNKKLEASKSGNERVRLNLLMDLLNESMNSDELVFIMNEEEKILIKSLTANYQQGIYMFVNSTHIFDNESDVQEAFANQTIIYSGNEVDNYSFTDSKASPIVQGSDVMMGIIGRFFSHLRTIDISEVENFVNNLDVTQSTNFDLILKLYNKSLDKNPAFINSIESDSELVKLNKINKLRGF